MKDLYNFLNTFTPISKKTWSNLEKIIKTKNYPAKTQLCKIGDIPRNIYYVIEGIATSYVRPTKGVRYNKELAGPKSFVASFSAAMQKTKSDIGLECLTECQVYEVTLDEFSALMKKTPELQTLYVKFLESNFIRYEKRTITLSTMNATERYILLRKEFPNIDNKIMQYHIASYLGITPIQLSRIRKELFGSSRDKKKKS